MDSLRAHASIEHEPCLSEPLGFEFACPGGLRCKVRLFCVQERSVWRQCRLAGRVSGLEALLEGCRGISLIRNSPPLGTFIRICLGPHGGPRGVGCFI